MSYETRSFELQLEPIKLECGVQLPRLPMRGWWAGPRSDLRLLGEAGVLLANDDPAHAALVPQPYLNGARRRRGASRSTGRARF